MRGHANVQAQHCQMAARSSRGSGSLHHADITRIMRTSRAAANRHHAAAAHSSALQMGSRNQKGAGTSGSRILRLQSWSHPKGVTVIGNINGGSTSRLSWKSHPLQCRKMGPVFVSILLTCVFLLVGKIFFSDFVKYVFCAFEVVFFSFFHSYYSKGDWLLFGPLLPRVTGCSWVLGSDWGSSSEGDWLLLHLKK
ncbi:hypothetical protein STEG23_014078 [Scotinomys teguina]